MQERIYKTQAVVLRRYDMGETARQLVLYTPLLGKVSAVARGVKRPTSKLAGHLEPLTLTHIVAAHGRNLDTVTQASTVEPWGRLRSEPERIFQGLLAAELLDKLTPDHEENGALWRLFVETLRRLDEEDDPWPAMLYYQVRLLVVAGYQPELEVCVQCEGSLDPAAVYYSARLGGLLCPAHRLTDAGSVQVSANAVKVLRTATSSPYPAFRRLRVSLELRAELDRLLRLNQRTMLEIELAGNAVLDAVERQVAERRASYGRPAAGSGSAGG